MKPEIIRDLGQGLILRRAALADAEPLAAFQGDRADRRPRKGRSSVA